MSSWLKLRTLKVEPIAGEVIDGEGIFDIHVINVFPTKHLLRFTKYLMLVLLLESCLEGMR